MLFFAAKVIAIYLRGVNLFEKQLYGKVNKNPQNHYDFGEVKVEKMGLEPTTFPMRDRDALAFLNFLK